eukprot:CFRG7592T1
MFLGGAYGSVKPLRTNRPVGASKSTSVANCSTGISGNLEIWEGFWAGWKPRWCVLSNSDFVIYSDPKNKKEIARITLRGENVRTSIDTRQTSGLEEKVNVGNSRGEKGIKVGVKIETKCGEHDKYLSFITHTSDKSSHVHIRAPTVMERDRWLLVMMNLDVQDFKSSNTPALTKLQHHLATTNVYCELLDNQVARLSNLNDYLAEHAEIFCLLREAQIATMTAHSVRVTLREALDWCARIDLWYEGKEAEEIQRQSEIRDLASWCTRWGRNEFEPISADRGISAEEEDGISTRCQLQNQFETELSQLGVYHDSLSGHSLSVHSRILNVKRLIAAMTGHNHMSASLSNGSQEQPGSRSNIKAQTTILRNAQFGAGQREIRTTNRVTKHHHFISSEPESQTKKAMEDSITCGAMVDTTLRGISAEYDNAISALEDRVYELSRKHLASCTHTDSLWRGVIHAVANTTPIATTTESFNERFPTSTTTPMNTPSSTPVPEKYNEWPLSKESSGQVVDNLADENGMQTQTNTNVHTDTDDCDEDIVDDIPLYRNLRSVLLTATYTFTLQSVFDVMFSSSCPGLKSLYKKNEYFDICIGDWAVDTDNILVQSRTNTYNVTVNTPLGAKTSITSERQVLTWNEKGSAFVCEATINAKGVPYGETFINTVKYTVKRSKAKECCVVISAELEWISKPYFSKISNLIESTSTDAMGDYASAWHRHVIDCQAQGMMEAGYLREIPMKVPPHTLKMPSIEKRSRSASRSSIVRSRESIHNKSRDNMNVFGEELLTVPTVLTAMSAVSATLSIFALVMGSRLRLNGS